MRQKSTNGALNIDTPDMEQMRQKVVEQELSARSWKAYYEKMYFSIEAEKLEPIYIEHQKRINERMEKEKKLYEDFIKKMQEEATTLNETNKLGDLNLESVSSPVIETNNNG